MPWGTSLRKFYMVVGPRCETKGRGLAVRVQYYDRCPISDLSICESIWKKSSLMETNKIRIDIQVSAAPKKKRFAVSSLV